MSIVAIARAIVGAAAKNMKQSKAGATSSESGYNIDAVKQQQPGLVMQQSPAMQNNATSPTANLSSFVGVSPQMQKQIPVIGQAIQGEESMLSNTNIPVVGGYTIQPQAFDSSTPYYKTRRMY